MKLRLALALTFLAAACQTVGPAPTRPGAVDPGVPVVLPGPISQADEAEARSLYESAETSYEARRYFEVVRTAAELVERFPSSSVSGRALLLTAKAQLELGEFDGADETAQRYVDLLPDGDPRATEARLVQANALQGRPGIQLDRLLRIGDAAEAEELEAATALAREATEALEPGELQAVLDAAPTDGPLAAIPLVHLALDLLESGDSTAAVDLARTALATGATEPEQGLAEGVLRGELPPDRARVTAFTIGTVLPESGPPALADFAELVAEGIEVAVATVLGEPFQVDVTEFDDESNPALSALLSSEMELEGIVGAVGFLEDEALLAAGQSRVDGMPIISPTARTASSAGEGVYSLEGPDPLAATEIAHYAVERAFQRVAIILPSSDAAIEEADAFEAEAARFGIPVVRRFYYEPGATFFENQVVGARDVLRAAEIAALGLSADDTLRVELLEPVGIFLPIPREDVEFVAPQIAHFALDTLGIEVVGTSAWTDPGVLEIVDPLYMNGVVATATVGAGPFSPGRVRFRNAYEDYFQRTLVSTTPALGYDAALLLLEALRPGRVQPAQVQEAFRNLRDVEGATGVFSIIDDRVVRRTEVVRINNRQLELLEVF